MDMQQAITAKRKNETPTELIPTGAVDRLVLVTPPSFLGILRAGLPPAVALNEATLPQKPTVLAGCDVKNGPVNNESAALALKVDRQP